MPSSGHRYFWLVAKDPDSGKPYLIYGGTTEDEARQKGLEMLGGIDFQIKSLPTRNLARASSLLKGNRLETTRSLKAASQRLGHSKTLKRKKRRRSSNVLPTWL